MQHPEQCYYPLVPGYETAGIVVAKGSDARQDLNIGDRVMLNECRQYGDVCAAWGGVSEFTIKDSYTTNNQFDYSVKLPYEVWGVSKVKEAFEHQAKAGADCFKILLDWRK